MRFSYILDHVWADCVLVLVDNAVVCRVASPASVDITNNNTTEHSQPNTMSARPPSVHCGWLGGGGLGY